MPHDLDGWAAALERMAASVRSFGDELPPLLVGWAEVTEATALSLRLKAQAISDLEREWPPRPAAGGAPVSPEPGPGSGQAG